MSPKRIQRKRTKGWRMPEGAVYVGRPTDWGNPYHIARAGSCHVSPRLASQWRNGGHWHLIYPSGGMWCYATRNAAAAAAVDLYRHALAVFEPEPDFWERIEGRDLACWCPLDQPCHADVLLELANGGAS